MTTTARARELVEMLDAEKRPGARLDLARRYAYTGDHDLPYMPRRVGREFRALAESSREHRIPAVLQTLSAPLRVVGFRTSGTSENAAPWANWQANGLDARQDGVHFDALAAGVSYVRVVPSGNRGDVAAITPCGFDSVLALYASADAEWPIEAIHHVGRGTDSNGVTRNIYDVWTPSHRQRFEEADRSTNTDGLAASEPVPHGLGVVPFVRFVERFGAPCQGLASTLKPQADRLNRALLSLEVVQQYASFRQRWATGLAIPVDEETGEPLEPFEAAVSRLWVSDSTDAKFGDFAQSDPSGVLANIADARTAMAVLAGVQPGLVEGLDVAGAKAGAAATSSSLMDRRIRSLSASFGEAWEQVLRLAAKVTGDSRAASDNASRVTWETVEAESVQATVTALATAVGALGLPPEATWPALVATIPGATADDLETWRALAAERDGTVRLASDYVRGGTTAAEPSEPADGAAVLSEAA
ncbi:phage portal protein [Isoptericola sp. NEAU-Y5]|uniref:Phage portal protein n=1 Tax=Isoptericola luteus TaxID=2879484 RepID=A0ABS7ZBZ6_9MICO|nr:phage portal protein [Isoptericola sp. NEAU-Y5]MCA5891982.1 phage portal protein [Isoptericola sp. NEAU-Y5]